MAIAFEVLPMEEVIANESRERNLFRNNFLRTSLNKTYDWIKNGLEYFQVSKEKKPWTIFGIIALQLLFVILEMYIPELFDALKFDAKTWWTYFTYGFAFKRMLMFVKNIFANIFAIPLEVHHGSWKILLLIILRMMITSIPTLLLTFVMKINKELDASYTGINSYAAAHITTIIMKWKTFKNPALPLIIYIAILLIDLAMGGYDNLYELVIFAFGSAFGSALAVVYLRSSVSTNLNAREDGIV